MEGVHTKWWHHHCTCSKTQVFSFHKPVYVLKAVCETEENVLEKWWCHKGIGDVVDDVVSNHRWCHSNWYHNSFKWSIIIIIITKLQLTSEITVISRDLMFCSLYPLCITVLHIYISPLWKKMCKSGASLHYLVNFDTCHVISIAENHTGKWNRA